MITRVMPKHMVKLHIIDLIGSLRLESLLNDVQFFLGHLHAEIVENGTEAGECDKSTSASIFVLEVWLN
jgi:hypothetical protein